MEQFNISVELANKILAYLGSRPYAEVEGLINEVRTAFNQSQEYVTATKLAEKEGDKKRK